MKVSAVALVILLGACSSGGSETPADSNAAESAAAQDPPAVPGVAPQGDTRLRDSAETGPVIEIPTIADTARRPPGS